VLGLVGVLDLTACCLVHGVGYIAGC
jgi:hypothetical protein